MCMWPAIWAPTKHSSNSAPDFCESSSRNALAQRSLIFSSIAASWPSALLPECVPAVPAVARAAVVPRSKSVAAVDVVPGGVTVFVPDEPGVAIALLVAPSVV